MTGDILGILLFLFPGFVAGMYYFRLTGRKTQGQNWLYVLDSLGFSFFILLVRCLIMYSGGYAQADVGSIFSTCRNFLLYTAMAAVLAVLLPNGAYALRWLLGLLTGKKKRS